MLEAPVPIVGAPKGQHGDRQAAREDLKRAEKRLRIHRQHVAVGSNGEVVLGAAG